MIEMGANHGGEIAHLASIAEPDIALVTNAGAAHLEGFGSLDGVAAGKGELFRELTAGRRGGRQCGRPIRVPVALNGRGPAPVDVRRRAPRRLHRASYLRRSNRTAAAAIRFWCLRSAPSDLSRSGGLHNLRNALARRRRRTRGGADLADITAGLAAGETSQGAPLEFRRPSMERCSWTIRNANPASVRAGLIRFARSRGPGGSCSAT